MQKDSIETRSFTATCHCRSSSLAFTIPIRSLPIPIHFCHCNRCRRTHGTLATIHAPIPRPDITNQLSFTKYSSSDLVERWFCKTCGAHMLDCATIDSGETKWYIAASMVGAEEGVWRFERHLFVGDTVDGGLAPLLSSIGGKELKMHIADMQSPVYQIPPKTEIPSDFRADRQGKNCFMRGKCHCGGVSFDVYPPSPSVFRDFPDYITPKDKTKWYALHDLCHSCRGTSGCAIVSWIFPVLSAIQIPGNRPHCPEDLLFGTMKTYRSSEGVLRAFCGVCGATVAYKTADSGDRIDIAAGLLQGNSARLEEWLEWRTERVAFGDDCVWPSLRISLEDGLKQYKPGEDGGKI